MRSAGGIAGAGVADQAERLALIDPFAGGQVWMVAGSMLELASKSNARSDFSRGKAAALMQPAEETELAPRACLVLVWCSRRG